MNESRKSTGWRGKNERKRHGREKWKGGDRNLKKSVREESKGKGVGSRWRSGGAAKVGEQRRQRKRSVFNLYKPHCHSEEVDRIHILK